MRAAERNPPHDPGRPRPERDAGPGGERPGGGPAAPPAAGRHARRPADGPEPAGPLPRGRAAGSRSLPRLNLQAWKTRLLDAVADRCVRHSRRDPRDSAPSEQMLYEQLDGALDACRQGRSVELVIEAAHWYQNVILGPEEAV